MEQIAEVPENSQTLGSACSILPTPISLPALLQRSQHGCRGCLSMNAQTSPLTHRHQQGARLPPLPQARLLPLVLTSQLGSSRTPSVSSCTADLCRLTDGPGKPAHSHQRRQAMGNASHLRGAAP